MYSHFAKIFPPGLISSCEGNVYTKQAIENLLVPLQSDTLCHIIWGMLFWINVFLAYGRVIVAKGIRGKGAKHILRACMSSWQDCHCTAHLLYFVHTAIQVRKYSTVLYSSSSGSSKSKVQSCTCVRCLYSIVFEKKYSSLLHECAIYVNDLKYCIAYSTIGSIKP